MKIRMNTTSAGPDGVREAGKVYDLPDKEADALITARVAIATTSARPLRRGNRRQDEE